MSFISRFIAHRKALQGRLALCASLGLAALLVGCSGGHDEVEAPPAASRQGLFNRPQAVVVHDVPGDAHAPILYVLNGDDSMTSCLLAREGQLTQCEMQAVEDADAVHDMAYNARTNTLHFLQYGDNPLVSCVNDDQGRLLECEETDGAGALRQSTSLGLNVDGSAAYVVNGDGTLAVCALTDAGDIAACALTNGHGQFSTPSSIELLTTSAGSYALVLNGEFTNTLTVCSLRADGLPGQCHEDTGHGTFHGMSTLAVHPDGHYVYAANLADDTISVCAFAGGALSSCSSETGAGAFSGIQQIVIDREGRNAYVVNARTSSITHCRIGAGGGALQACTPYTIDGFRITTGMTIFDDGQARRAYITSLDNDALYSCRLGADGRFADGQCLQMR